MYDISNLVEVDLHNIIILNIEFGVNLNAKFSPNNLASLAVLAIDTAFN